MSRFGEKVETTANILIICVALLVGFVVAQRYFFSSPPPQQARLQPQKGMKMDLPDVNWADRQKTLILALNKRCHFCNESAPFYKRLVENTRTKNVKIVAVFPGMIEESTKHLNELGLVDLEVRSSPLNNIQVSGTPTLILTNEKGEVTDYWLGKLSPEKENEVINKLSSL